MTTTFSSVQMRERDKLLEDKHKKETEALERKLERVRRSLNDADREIFDLRNRNNQLAQALGFSDIGEAQRAIDVSDYEATFKQAFERVQVLETEVRTEQKQKEQLQLRCQELEGEVTKYREYSASKEKSERRLQQELRDLQLQFDSLKDSMQRTVEGYKKDRKKFYGIYHWLFIEPLRKKGKMCEGLSAKETQGRSVHRRREVLREFGPGLMKLLDVDFATLQAAALDNDSDTTLHFIGHSSQTPTRADSERTNPFDERHGPSQQQILPDFGDACTTSGQSQLQPSRQPLAPLSIANVINREDDEAQETRKLDKAPGPFNSSDTEDDSQAPSQDFKLPLPPVTRPPGHSSDTEDDSQAPNPLSSPVDLPPETPPFSAVKPINKRLMRSDLPSRPSFDSTMLRSDPRALDLPFLIKTEPEDAPDVSLDERPTKRPRVSPNTFKTPQPRKPSAFPRFPVSSTGRIKKRDVHYDDENTPVSKVVGVARDPKTTKHGDYSTYKGRGRYGKENDSSTKTINSLFTINPERNGGMTHQYEEVVRSREGRMQMDAGDCECCRDYYVAVGELPARDHGPLWRSPSTTPVKACRRRGAASGAPTHNRTGSDFSLSDGIQANIEAHKKVVSRHRHNWARAQTPPGYWNIGFPDTQEARDINMRAEEMHQRKLREVEKAADGGRWLRR